jgi:endonuclease/exonuclease/phosphatase family metal-dependent hydrolase
MRTRVKLFFRAVFRIANIITMICYLLACLVPFVNAGKSWFIAMMGLFFPLLFFVLAAFLVYWLFRRSAKWIIACLAVLLTGWVQLSVMFGFHLPKKFSGAKAPETIRILTWNLSAWGQSNAIDKNRQDNQQPMLELIKKADADVLCFEEYVYLKDKKVEDSVLPALRESGFRYSYFVRTKFNERIFRSTRLITTIIISKYPITDTAHYFYTDEQLIEPLIYADIKIREQTIRVFASKLESVRFARSDFEALRNLKEPVKASIGSSKLIAYKLRNAYKARAVQAAVLAKKIKESPHPVIVCGDFNDVPNSYTYFTVKGKLQDAHLKKGSGFGRSLRMISPTLRIDYILADKKFDVLQCHVFKTPYSDHYPVVTDLKMPGN